MPMVKVKYTGKRAKDGPLYTIFDADENPVSFDPGQEKMVNFSKKDADALRSGKGGPKDIKVLDEPK